MFPYSETIVVFSGRAFDQYLLYPLRKKRLPEYVVCSMYEFVHGLFVRRNKSRDEIKKNTSIEYFLYVASGWKKNLDHAKSGFPVRSIYFSPYVCLV